MISFKENFDRIRTTSGVSVSYREDFISRPKSLRDAIRSMIAPRTSDWRGSEVAMDSTSWTNQCNGVASDGTYWIFSANNSGRAKKLYTFRIGETPYQLNDWAVVDTFTFGKTLEGLTIYHVGQLTFFGGELYVSHFNDDGAQALVFRVIDGRFHYVRAIHLQKIQGRRVELQAINPWDGMLYTSFGDGEIGHLFIHDMDGTWTGGCLPLVPPLKPTHSHRDIDSYSHHPIQGACFSPNGHLYVSSNNHPDGDESHQVIRYYSALTGREFGFIKVLAEGPRQELEGICWHRGAIHAVLLDVYPYLASDNVFFKTFTTDLPDHI